MFSNIDVRVKLRFYPHCVIKYQHTPEGLVFSLCSAVQGSRGEKQLSIVSHTYSALERGAITLVQVSQQIVRVFPNIALLFLIIREEEFKAGDLSIPSTFWELSLAKYSLSLLHHCWNLRGSKWDDTFSHLSFCHHALLTELFEIPKLIKWAVQPFNQARNSANDAFPEMEMQILFPLLFVQWGALFLALQLLGGLQCCLLKLWKWYCAFWEGGGRARESVWYLYYTVSALCSSWDVKLTVHKHCYWKYILPLIATTALTDSNYPSFSGTIKSPLIQDLCSYSI